MAKKTSYLTELIERHERWKAEGGERVEEEDRNPIDDTYGPISFALPYSSDNN